MRALEFILNGKRVCIIAPEADGLVMGKVMMFADINDARLHIRGVCNDEHLEWIDPHLSVGDILEIRIVEINETDPPKSRIPHTPESKSRLKVINKKFLSKNKKSAIRKRN